MALDAKAHHMLGWGSQTPPPLDPATPLVNGANFLWAFPPTLWRLRHRFTSDKHFSLVPLAPTKTQDQWGLNPHGTCHGDLLLGLGSPGHGPPERPRIGAVSWHLNIFELLTFPKPFVARCMGLGDHLVTIQVLWHPWRPLWWPLGPCSPGHGPPQVPKLLLFRLFGGTL